MNAEKNWAGVPLPLHAPYRWITDKQFRAAGLEVIISLSRVGFRRDYRVALVETGYYCGALCGSNHLVFLRRDADNVWRVTRKYLVSVS